ncbi:MAG: hypothetical protein QOH97_1317 [Actinoplanes sp.]|nr:hypothetical protein [Actinoplanes sp.]
MPNTYIAFNGVPPTTAAMPPVTTGTVIKTLLQIATPSTCELRVVEWGISFDGSAAATPIKVELIDTNVAATVTAHSTSTVICLNRTGGVASKMTMSTTATGYTASAEGTITNTAILDYQLIAPTGQFVKQWPLGLEPQLAVSRFLRVRVTAAAAVNAVCYVVWTEA